MKLYNTLTRTIEDFQPIDRDNVRIYTCGPTVYKEVHIGNLRTYITSDILCRAVKFNNYGVTSVMNITDVGHMRYQAASQKQIDPIMIEAATRNVTPLDLARYYTNLFIEDSKKINLDPPNVLPRASDHIEEMKAIIQILIDKGIAYETKGNVYFNVKKFRDYGKLSRNTLDKMERLLEAVRISVETDKKDSADFALWKKAPADSVMKWSSPWGEGVPGWHIECSAMSIKYLGDTFDIHTGGEDLIFPHHEDEIAQSEAASGAKFVNYWIHSSFLTVDDEKMSRSKGNVYTVYDIENNKFNPLAFRLLTFQTHYRSKMNFTWEALAGAQEALEKLYGLASNLPAPEGECAPHEFKFMDALNTDLNMPQAMAVIWEMLRSKNTPAAKANSLRRLDEVLGLKIFENAKLLHSIPERIREMVRERNALRKQKKFHLADGMRAKIEKAGYVIKDSEKGTRVLRKL